MHVNEECSLPLALPAHLHQFVHNTAPKVQVELLEELGQRNFDPSTIVRSADTPVYMQKLE